MDNRHSSCPPLMSDKRLFTNYYDNDIFNQSIRVMNNINDNHDYRLFLQSNASELMNREREFNLQVNTCNKQQCCHRK